MKKVALGLLVLYLIALFYVTVIWYRYSPPTNYGYFFNLKPSIHRILVSDVYGLSYKLKNLLGNILLYVPFGFLFPIALGHKWSSLLWVSMVAISLTLMLEVTQMLFSHRIFDINDIILNIIGAVAGYLLYKTLFLSLHHKRVANNG